MEYSKIFWYVLVYIHFFILLIINSNIWQWNIDYTSIFNNIYNVEMLLTWYLNTSMKSFINVKNYKHKIINNLNLFIFKYYILFIDVVLWVFCSQYVCFVKKKYYASRWKKRLIWLVCLCSHSYVLSKRIHSMESVIELSIYGLIKLFCQKVFNYKNTNYLLIWLVICALSIFERVCWFFFSFFLLISSKNLEHFRIFYLEKEYSEFVNSPSEELFFCKKVFYL